MSKILVCQHIAYEILGTLNPLFKRSGFRIHYINFDRHPNAEPSLEGYKGLIILGGPMNVDQTAKHPHLNYEMYLIEDAIRRDIPVLGICLGSQLIAKALGTKVYPNKEKEIGWYDVRLTRAGEKDPVLTHFQKTEKIFQWHGDTFDIPKGAVHLAKTKECHNQAFRYNDRVYAFQFHLEVDEPMIERWLRVPHHKKELAKLKGKIDPHTIKEETKLYIHDLMKLSDLTFGEFIKLFGKKEKYKRLPSR